MRQNFTTSIFSYSEIIKRRTRWNKQKPHLIFPLVQRRDWENENRIFNLDGLQNISPSNALGCSTQNQKQKQTKTKTSSAVHHNDNINNGTKAEKWPMGKAISSTRLYFHLQYRFIHIQIVSVLDYSVFGHNLRQDLHPWLSSSRTLIINLQGSWIFGMI